MQPRRDLRPHLRQLRRLQRALEKDSNGFIPLTVLCGEEERDGRFGGLRLADDVLVVSFGDATRYLPLAYVGASWTEREHDCARNYVDVTPGGWRVMFRRAA